MGAHCWARCMPFAHPSSCARELQVSQRRPQHYILTRSMFEHCTLDYALKSNQIKSYWWREPTVNRYKKVACRYRDSNMPRGSDSTTRVNVGPHSSKQSEPRHTGRQDGKLRGADQSRRLTARRNLILLVSRGGTILAYIPLDTSSPVHRLLPYSRGSRLRARQGKRARVCHRTRRCCTPGRGYSRFRQQSIGRYSADYSRHIPLHCAAYGGR